MQCFLIKWLGAHGVEKGGIKLREPIPGFGNQVCAPAVVAEVEEPNDFRSADVSEESGSQSSKTRSQPSRELTQEENILLYHVEEILELDKAMMRSSDYYDPNQDIGLDYVVDLRQKLYAEMMRGKYAYLGKAIIDAGLPATAQDIINMRVNVPSV